ncbi:uncharacterized protein EDB93DRAFT_1328040 [Suillus bovinus]|uniref:uncharacterized protein n=1 Tax=Suillus bovinus TaxID=48563 RepID=UPI001B8704BE|nr:uncharacterized protein EDB93DRAFT_1328040 [Suillus bovinus]KAG2150255.1 hypothetical protein EDB93DRAFT_1328040 [Suillus bovinus]
MDPPKSKTTIRISTNLGLAGQFMNTSMTTIELKGRTAQEKGEHYLQLSLKALEELAGLLEDKRLSEDQRTSYCDVYETSMNQHLDMIELRNQLLSKKKSFRDFVVNLFVRESDAKRFHKITYRNFANIRRTSDDLHRMLLPDRKSILASASLTASAQGDVSVHEESPRDVVEGNCPVKDLPPDAHLKGFNLDVRTEEEADEAIVTLIRMTAPKQEEEEEENDDDDDDDDKTIRPSRSSCTIIYNYNINQSVVSFDSESNGTTLNVGMDGGVGSSSGGRPDSNQPSSC